MAKPKKSPASRLKSLQILEQMLDCVGSPVFAKDREHRFVYLNRAASVFLGRSNDQMLGKSDYDFFPKEQADVFWKFDDEVFNSRAENVNETACRRLGS